MGKANVKKIEIWECDHCKRPMGYESEEMAIKHSEECIFDKDNKSCLMCEHLKVIQVAPYPQNMRNFKGDVRWGIGSFRIPHCMKFEKDLTEDEFVAVHDACFDFGENDYVIENSEDYLDWQDKVDAIDAEYDKLKDENS